MLPPQPILNPDAELDEPRRRRFPWKSLAAILVLGALGAGAYILHSTGQLSTLPFIGKSVSTAVPVVRAPKEAMKDAPLKTFSVKAEDIDATFQKAPLWQILKKEFPDWYRERVDEAARLKGEKKDDQDIAICLTQSIVELRRKHATSAFSASPAQLKTVAIAFVANLGELAKHSTEACYGFISQGESSPVVVDLMRSSDYTTVLQTQLTTVFQAIVEGRKTPKEALQPKREDYDVLAAQLAVRGWSPADLQLFSDSRALSRAAPAKVCQMVQDWFAAQLAVKDEDIKIRLLTEALKPVIAG